MAMRQCRWCLVSANGDIAIHDHERHAHPHQYWLAQAEVCRRQAQRLIEQAEKYGHLAEGK